ncbi:DUF5677 domain-containing protein [Clostridium perfringens]
MYKIIYDINNKKLVDIMEKAHSPIAMKLLLEMYIMVLETAEAYFKYVDCLNKKNKEDKMYRYMAMVHIYGRALQEFIEIITIMKNSFADEAYARWRFMYELTIISSFINKYGENVAKAYINARDTHDRYEWARNSGIFSLDKKYISFNYIQKFCDINTTIWRK